jgi:hypothetical protein
MLDMTAIARVCDSFDQLSGDLGLTIGTVATVHRHFAGEVFPPPTDPQPSYDGSGVWAEPAFYLHGYRILLCLRLFRQCRASAETQENQH